MINDQKTRSEGYEISVRWGSLREDLKVEYKAEAERLFEQWKADEIEAENNRNKIVEEIIIKNYDE